MKYEQPKIEKVDGFCPVCKSTNIRKDFDFPGSMVCCQDCLSDFITDGEIIFNGKTFQDGEQNAKH